MRIESVFQNLATFNLWGVLIAGILLVASRFFPLPIPIGFAIALPIVIASAIAVGLNLMRKIDLFAVAHLVDQRLSLKERLGTALEAMDRRGTGDFAICRFVMLHGQPKGSSLPQWSPTRFQRLSNGCPFPCC